MRPTSNNEVKILSPSNYLFAHNHSNNAALSISIFSLILCNWLSFSLVTRFPPSCFCALSSSLSSLLLDRAGSFGLRGILASTLPSSSSSSSLSYSLPPFLCPSFLVEKEPACTAHAHTHTHISLHSSPFIPPSCLGAQCCVHTLPAPTGQVHAIASANDLHRLRSSEIMDPG